MLLFRFSSYSRNSKPRPDYYKLLGVRKDATQEEIKAAFYAKSKLLSFFQLHPDRADSKSGEAFVELKQAYDVLRRPADRRAYDMIDHEYEREKYTDPYFHRHYYQQYYQQDRSRIHKYAFSREWARFWGENPNARNPFVQNRPMQEWQFILKWSAFGIFLVLLYNLGYIYIVKSQENQLSKLVDEDEIAKSFMRQAEFRDKETNSVEMYELARKLKGDVDEAWRRKVENFAGRNPNEIREEYRWLRAVQDVNHDRRVKALRAEVRRRNREKASEVTPENASADAKTA
ncbi:DnaJ domain protein [Oesophagostomum dentatum]|uniref:DnaJ domain protein n=1 Tax=Oesophagostomum dentatum TaxID=61180 RepID=A0A0B1SX33_OESDE|nr:DnaJ domain protein [Oesophagostomum dentatum]